MIESFTSSCLGALLTVQPGAACGPPCSCSRSKTLPCASLLQAVWMRGASLPGKLQPLVRMHAHTCRTRAPCSALPCGCERGRAGTVRQVHASAAHPVLCSIVAKQGPMLTALPRFLYTSAALVRSLNLLRKNQHGSCHVWQGHQYPRPCHFRGNLAVCRPLFL